MGVQLFKRINGAVGGRGGWTGINMAGGHQRTMDSGGRLRVSSHKIRSVLVLCHC